MTLSCCFTTLLIHSRYANLDSSENEYWLRLGLMLNLFSIHHTDTKRVLNVLFEGSNNFKTKTKSWLTYLSCETRLNIHLHFSVWPVGGGSFSFPLLPQISLSSNKTPSCKITPRKCAAYIKNKYVTKYNIAININRHSKWHKLW